MTTKTDDRKDFDEFLEHRVALWRATVKPSVVSLPAYLGMTPETYGDWVNGSLDDPGYQLSMHSWLGWKAQLAMFRVAASRRG